MASRYALRGVEGAIGYDCRRLPDGRIASFRHTYLHNRARREFFERRDAIDYLRSAYISLSCLASNPRMEIESSRDAVSESRVDLIKAMFPYLDVGGDSESKKAKEEIRYEDYEEYFDELDMIEDASEASHPQQDEAGRGL